MRVRTVLLVFLTTILLAGPAAASEVPASANAPAAPKARIDPAADTWYGIYELCKESVLRTQITRQNGGGWSNAVGSAFIITEDGYVLSNSHVVGDGQGTLEFIFYDGKRYPFSVIAAGNSIDIALLKIDTGDDAVAFKPIKLGRSNNLRRGQPVAAMGNPGGAGLKISAGIVSGLGRGSGYEWSTGSTWRNDMIQTDAKITGGNSGGALINQNGEVVGMVSGTRYIAQRISFAIPIDEVIRAMPRTLTVEERNGFVPGIVVEPVRGGEITEAAEGSPAQRAGLGVGDVIVSVDGKPLERGLDYYIALIERSPGDVLHFEVRRDGEAFETDLTLQKIKPRVAQTLDGPVAGVNFEFYEGGWAALPNFDELQPVQTGVADAFGINAYKNRDGFAVRFSGYVQVPQEGAYTFHIGSDDGSQLFIGDKLVVDNDGLHATAVQKGTILLEAGLHPIRVTFFEGAGGEVLDVLYEGPGVEKQTIPPSVLFHVESSREVPPDQSLQ